MQDAVLVVFLRKKFFFNEDIHKLIERPEKRIRFAGECIEKEKKYIFIFSPFSPFREYKNTPSYDYLENWDSNRRFQGLYDWTHN